MPWSSVSTGTNDAVPRPSSRNERSMVACRSEPVTTRTRGAPTSPSVSTSWPACSSTRCRPQAMPTVLAAWAPVTNPTEAPPGSPSRSFTQPPAARSAASAAGDSTGLKAFWSHPTASRSAAVAAGVEPPTTKPK